MYQCFKDAVRDIYETAHRENRLLKNPSQESLRAYALDEPEVRTTRHGNLVAFSEPTSRAKPFTRSNLDEPFGQAERELLESARRRLSEERLVSIDVAVGDGSEDVTARLIVPKRFAHVAYGGAKLFRQLPSSVGRPTHQVLMFFDQAFEANKEKRLPEKDITIRNALGPDGGLVKIVRNSNYVGEWKKGVFTGEDYRAKLKGSIFLHAGCRRDILEQADGGYRAVSSLFVALSANGKTSLTSKVLAFKHGEESWLVQDDGGTLNPDGSFDGFEPGGIFVKTEGLSPKDQIECYYGVLRPGSFLENVHVNDDGYPDFFNIERTANGRAVIERRDFMHSHKDIGTPRVDNLFLITRGPTIPALSLLSAEEAVAFMILGQSMESSAGDPTQAGAIKNVFFYDPFVVGDRTAHAARFHEILKANPHIRCYLLNTGGVGEGEHHRDIGLSDTMNMLNACLRGDIVDWAPAPATGLTVPASVRRVDSILFHPEKLYTAAEFTARQQALDARRREVLDRYPGLDPAISQAIRAGA